MEVSNVSKTELSSPDKWLWIRPGSSVTLGVYSSRSSSLPPALSSCLLVVVPPPCLLLLTQRSTNSCNTNDIEGDKHPVFLTSSPLSSLLAVSGRDKYVKKTWMQ